MSESLHFIGPSIIKKNLLYDVNFKKSKLKSNIVRATLDINGFQYILHENKFTAEYPVKRHKYINNHTVNVYHRFNYFNENGQVVCCRWYDDLSLDVFRTMTTPVFIHKIKNFEVDNESYNAVITIEFQPECLDTIHEFAYTVLRPPRFSPVVTSWIY